MKNKETVALEEKHELLRMSEIGLWLDTYDDIFSDFDPRPYSQRALSDDFLNEARKASRGKATGSIEIKFLIPKMQRSIPHEQTIKRRLREHFTRHFNSLNNDRKKTIREGTLFVAFGIVTMFITTLIMFEQDKSLLLNFLIILLEPAGWFLFWEGLNQAIFSSRKIRPELDFYEKMTRCEITFNEY